MTLPEYLEAMGLSENALSIECDIPQRTVNAINARGGSCTVRSARAIVDYTRANPAPGGGFVDYEDFAEGW